jgi:hypothetical protein
MIEKCQMKELGGTGFLINPLFRINCYNFPTKWTFENFKSIYEQIKIKLNNQSNTVPDFNSSNENLNKKNEEPKHHHNEHKHHSKKHHHSIDFFLFNFLLFE